MSWKWGLNDIEGLKNPSKVLTEVMKRASDAPYRGRNDSLCEQSLPDLSEVNWGQ